MFGIEGTGSYCAGLTGFPRRCGHPIIEVTRVDRRRRGKSDSFDAETAVRWALSGTANFAPKTPTAQPRLSDRSRSLPMQPVSATRRRSSRYEWAPMNGRVDQLSGSLHSRRASSASSGRHWASRCCPQGWIFHLWRHPHSGSWLPRQSVDLLNFVLDEPDRLAESDGMGSFSIRDIAHIAGGATLSSLGSSWTTDRINASQIK